MKTETAAILKSALALPAKNRATLAEKLLDSLVEKKQKEIDAAWAEEAEDRLKAFKEGKIKGIPMEEVFRSIRRGKKR